MAHGFGITNVIPKYKKIENTELSSYNKKRGKNNG
jgi:hypothetical protein